jgi:soluble lytic murein transglycosylase
MRNQLSKSFVAVLFSASLMSSSNASAIVILSPVTMASEPGFTSSRWMFGEGEAPKGDTVAALMAGARRAQIDGDYDTCVKKAEGAFSKTKTVQAWIALTELDCSSKLKPSAASADHINKIIATVNKNPNWLLLGPQASLLRGALLRASLAQIEMDSKTNKARAADAVERTQELLSYADDKTRAQFWRVAGEVAHASQRFEEARELMKRSLAEVDNEEVRARLNSIDNLLAPKTKDTKGADSIRADSLHKSSPESIKTLEASKEELDLVDRVTAALKSGDLVSAGEDGIKLINGYPGGNRAKWAYDRVLEAYWSVAEKSDTKFFSTHEKLVRAMQRADGDRVADWARNMFARGQYDDALVLARRAIETVQGARSTSIVELAAKAAWAVDKFPVAREMLDRLVHEHAGTKEAREAILKSGILHYRQGEYAQSSADFERALSLPQSDAFEIIARYWNWRALQKLKNERAEAAGDELMRKFPFSYYGLRVRLERSSGVLEWKNESSKLSTQTWMTSREKSAFERAETLMKAGWLDEAQSELKLLPLAQNAEEKAIRALLWAAAGQYASAAKLANDAWDEKPELRRSPFVNVAFPSEFKTAITAQAATRKVDPYLVQGLIKQESNYNSRAVSGSGALGLMQMIPLTARDMAQDLRLGNLQMPDDMFQPARNIQMGTYYLARLVNKYQGTVPVALAAYNLGPTKIDRWIKSRPSLKDVVTLRSSKADDELWFDEIPYWETSGYVKSVLRNILLYKMLDLGRVQISEPLWSADSL